VLKRSNQSVVTSSSASFSGGESVTVTFGTPLDADTDYVLNLLTGGSNADGREFDGTGFTSGSVADVIGGWLNGGDTTNVYDVSSIEFVSAADASAATVAVEWPKPADVFAWDRLSFQAAPDGETVEVYVEESSDGGSTWTEVAGPVRRGDAIPVDPQNRVRFRIELSRADTANDPTLGAVARRYVL
jgi:hypothetical protein